MLDLGKTKDMSHLQKLIYLFKKTTLLNGIFTMMFAHAGLSQAADATKQCDLYFSNSIRLKAVPTVETEAEKRKGLSNRESAGVGMLFVYAEAAPRAFWMHNTLIPLTAGFLDANGVIINIVHMQPNTDTLHKSAKPTQTVLELGEGEFEKYGLKKGVRLEMKVCMQKDNSWK